jgi:hypothetical protein
VWERSPYPIQEDWRSAQWRCWATQRGGRAGWRLPTISELESLQEYCPDQWLDQLLPCGHPFNNVSSEFRDFWSATTWFDSNEALAWSPYSGSGSVTKTVELCHWCVRGGTGSNYQFDSIEMR